MVRAAVNRAHPRRPTSERTEPLWQPLLDCLLSLGETRLARHSVRWRLSTRHPHFRYALTQVRLRRRTFADDAETVAEEVELADHLGDAWQERNRFLHRLELLGLGVCRGHAQEHRQGGANLIQHVGRL